MRYSEGLDSCQKLTWPQRMVTWDQGPISRAVIDTPHIDVPTIAVNRWLQSCHLDALIDASRWQKKEKLRYLRPQNCEECCGRWSVPTCVSRHVVYKRNIVVTCGTFLLQCNRKCVKWGKPLMKERKFTISLVNIRCSGMGRRYGMTNNYDQWYIIQRSQQCSWCDCLVWRTITINGT